MGWRKIDNPFEDRVEKKIIRTIKPLKLNLNVPMKFERVELIDKKC
jgi:hypothetical protein